MAQRGRKPKPTAVKVLEGNPGKRSLNTSGYWQQVPQVSIAQTYLKIMNKFCEQFGLTPSARSRISTDSGEDKQNDEMELLLVKGGAG